MTNIPYEAIPIRESGEPMVEAGDFDLASEPIYFKQKYAATPRQFLRQGVAQKLRQIETKTLHIHGLRFKIWDAWRPRGVQAALYRDYFSRLQKDHPDWDEAALHKAAGVFITRADDPARVPPHATGGSVDLTLIDGQGNELNMGTGFDHFGPEAALAYYEEENRDSKIRDNRRLLLKTLTAAGFGADSDEWWHYDYGNQKWALATAQPTAFYGEGVEGPSGSPILAIKSDV